MTAKETANFVLDNLVHLNQNDKDNYLRRLIDLILKEDVELTALRSWKEKARPFIEKRTEFMNDLQKHCSEYYQHKEKIEHAILTELLGGDDEN